MEHIDAKTMIGDPARIGTQIGRLADAGFQELIYTPSGPDVARELTCVRVRVPDDRRSA